ncbi:hypothetical protein Bbelb_411620 [Branchiostoma belcheri]|nr:hypothetical protein Bbelb_411620 [Branchiostoma belcheri]
MGCAGLPDEKPATASRGAMYVTPYQASRATTEIRRPLISGIRGKAGARGRAHVSSIPAPLSGRLESRLHPMMDGPNPRPTVGWAAAATPRGRPALGNRSNALSPKFPQFDEVRSRIRATLGLAGVSQCIILTSVSFHHQYSVPKSTGAILGHQATFVKRSTLGS